ncbi:MAG: GNAT family N-acetyltransferase [Deltaproteobacteria bacterium]|nr:GNAT family N-acetyltransferase [Deltaproteobacteria bacterium]
MTSSDEIILVPADPGNVALVPELMFATDPYIWSYLFNGQRSLFDRYIMKLWPHRENIYSYDTTTAAMMGDQLLGIEMGYPVETIDNRNRKTREVASGLFDDAMVADMVVRGRLIDYILPNAPKRAYKLHTLSITENARNRGLGKLLLENAFEKARSHGLKSVHLGVYADNSAVRFYKRMGMEILVETRVPRLEAHGIKKHYQMVKEL